jgi:CO/xanthine dehydrogenase FAD-binding subunit
MMIIEYHRPETIDDALSLLSRKDPSTVVLGGGLYLNEVVKSPIAVVDIQSLGLEKIQTKGKKAILGAGITLQAILKHQKIPQALLEAIKYQETYNRRQIATIGGTLIAATGRSAITGVMLALDAEIELEKLGEKSTKLHLGDFLPVREEHLQGRLLTRITIPTEIKTEFEYVARSPADLPIVAAAVSQWPAGRTRAVLAGYGDQPIMVFDGPDSKGADIAARDAYSQAEDQWARADYRSEMAAVLVQRCLNNIADEKEG